VWLSRIYYKSYRIAHTHDSRRLFRIAAVLYFSVRVQTEGLNMETLVKELEMSCGGTGNYKNVLLVEGDDEVV
jgi:hypothetical protein